MKLRHSEVKSHREHLLHLQGYLCALCGDTISDDAVLDHCHKTGKIRKVLHRGCNAMLGKIENNLARNKMTSVRLTHFIDNLIDYLTRDYEDIVHPTYKTREERKMSGRGRGRGKKPPKR